MSTSDKQIKKKATVITAGLIAAIIFFLLIVYVLWQITDEIVLENETAFDLNIFEFLSYYTTPSVTSLMLICTFFGSALFIVPAYFLLAAFYLFYKREKLQALGIISIGLLSRLVLFIIKNIFQRDRPLEPLVDVSGFSYPSGHSFSSFTFFGLLTYITWKSKLPKISKWILSVFFIGFAFCIATSRVYLHVHYASDVIAGFCLSLLWLAISLWVLRKIEKINLNSAGNKM